MGSADLLQSKDTPHTLVAGNVDDNQSKEVLFCVRGNALSLPRVYMYTYCPLFIMHRIIGQSAPETAKQQQTWQERQENQQESWERFRPRIFEELMYSSLPPDTVIKPVYIHVQCCENIFRT